MKKKLLLLICLILVCIPFIPHNKVTTNNKNFNVYIGDNGEYTKYNKNSLPKGGYLLNEEKSSCTNGGTISQDFNTREVSVNTTKEDKCNLYYDRYFPNIYEVLNDSRFDSSSIDVIDNGDNGLTGNNLCTNTLAYDGTSDNNLRYVGKKPCNYVTFNGETAGWRIVGVMNNIDDGTGNTERRIKLIRATRLGNYSWDTSDSTVNSGEGVNDWTRADLMAELNGDYLDTSLTANTNWYNGKNNAQTGVFDYTKGLSQAAQSLIGDAKWNLGGHNNTTSSTASILYTAERGTTVWGNPGGTCNDGACPRATEWTGKVALIYPSDYGYAVGGTVRSTCLGKAVSTYGSSDYCYTNDWICISSDQWLLSPRSGESNYAFYIWRTGYVGFYYTYSTYSVLPAVYLKSSVSITGGDGSPENPYTLG